MSGPSGRVETVTRFATAYDKLDAEWSGVLATRARRSVAAWTADFDEAREEQLALLERGLWRRGPDDFLIGRSRAELVHSAMVGWLLDPLGHHSVGPRLLSRVLARTRWEPGELSDVNVELEVSRTYVLPGKLMAEVSTFHTITGPPEVLDAEVSRAYQALIGAPLDAEPRVFGHGHAYAFGLEEADYRKWAFRSAFVSSRGEAPMVEELELMLLAGPPERLPFWHCAPNAHVRPASTRLRVGDSEAASQARPLG